MMPGVLAAADDRNKMPGLSFMRELTTMKFDYGCYGLDSQGVARQE